MNVFVLPYLLVGLNIKKPILRLVLYFKWSESHTSYELYSLSMYNCIIIQEIIQLPYKLFSSSDKKSFKSESIKLYIKLDKTKYLLFSFEL